MLEFLNNLFTASSKFRYIERGGMVSMGFGNGIADLSKSKLSFDARNSNSIHQNNNSLIGDGWMGRGLAIGMIGNNESSVLMDLNRASIVKA